MNYSLVDQKEFFKRPEIEDIDEILEVLYNFQKSEWPYFGSDIDNTDYTVEDQPLTHVQVKHFN